MKKTLLSIATVSLCAMTAMANDHALVFTGDNDLYGLTRQTTTDVNSMEFVSEINFSEAGIDFSLKNTAETGLGFALVDAGNNKSGIMVYSGFAADTFMSPEVTLTVPGGKITSAKLFMSGAGLIALSIPFNGKEIDCDVDGSKYYWEWNDEEGVETLSFGWNNTYSTRYIQSIELTYSVDLGDKKESGLAFNEKAVDAILGQPFTAPELSNPNDLPLTWSSSDENVATVDSEGNVTLIAGGKTFIIVETEGNDEYAEGTARYELNVIPSAANITELKEFAPELYDRVQVNFPATVTFANGNFAFVIDAEGNATCFEDIRNQGSTSTTSKTLYKVGEVIPAGWIATNATTYSSALWQGIPDAVTETVEVTYPKVTAVTPEDENRVVILKNVTFTTATAAENTKAYGTTPDGASYEFQDTYNTKQYPAGSYDVTVVVKYAVVGSTVYFYLAPIAYDDCEDAGIEMLGTAGADTRFYDLNGLQTENPDKGIYVKIANGKTSKVVIK